MRETTSNYAVRLQATVDLLREISENYRPAVLANGFGPESMVLTDLIVKHGFDIEIISLDTGRLPEETHELAQNVFKRYGPIIKMLAPDPQQLLDWTSRHGTNAFYQSVERRSECCGIRKVATLKRALAGKKAWLTGLRREQASSRSQLTDRAWDADNQLHKFNPMIEWTGAELWGYIHEHTVPYNALHDKGYPSVGCAPCTRATGPGEDPRAGRWWWEREAAKECGLHIDPVSGRLQRSEKPKVTEP